MEQIESPFIKAVMKHQRREYVRISMQLFLDTIQEYCDYDYNEVMLKVLGKDWWQSDIPLENPYDEISAEGIQNLQIYPCKKVMDLIHEIVLSIKNSEELDSEKIVIAAKVITQKFNEKYRGLPLGIKVGILEE